MTDYIPYFTAFGLGSIITALVQTFLARWTKNTERVFAERKEAYVGLLEAWVRQEDADFSDHASRDAGHWLTRAKLVASNPTYRRLCKWEELEPGSPERAIATNALRDQMRKDLT